MRILKIIGYSAFAFCFFSLTEASPALAQKKFDCKFPAGGDFKSREEYRIYQLHSMSEEYKLFDENCNGAIDPQERKNYEAFVQNKLNQKLRDFDRQARIGLSMPAPKPKAKDPLDCDMSPRAGWRSCLIVRESFEDIAIFSNPKSFKLASGAQLNWTQDRITENSIWSAKGVVAYPFAWNAGTNPEPRSAIDPYIVGFALTPSMSINRLSNSNAAIAKKKNVDVISYNAGGEVAVGHLLDATTTHYFRGRFGIQNDSANVTQARAITLEYQPITTWQTIPNVSSPNTLSFLPLTYQVDPIIRYQYLEASGDTDLAFFAMRDKVSRVGPVIALSVMPENVDSVPDWFKQFNFNLSYSWLKDWDSDITYRYFLASLGFAIDPAGHFGVKISYETGQVEETGQDVKITRVGLSARF